MSRSPKIRTASVNPGRALPAKPKTWAELRALTGCPDCGGDVLATGSGEALEVHCLSCPFALTAAGLDAGEEVPA